MSEGEAENWRRVMLNFTRAMESYAEVERSTGRSLDALVAAIKNLTQMMFMFAVINGLLVGFVIYSVTKFT